MMLHLWYVVDEWIKDPGCQLLPGEKQTAAEISEKLRKLGEGLFHRLDKEYGHKVIRDLETTNLVVQRATQVYESINIAKRSSIDYIATYAIFFCNSQNREGCIKFKKCPMYQALADAGVPTCQIETNACPYRGESYRKKTKTWEEVVVDIPEIKLPYKQTVCPDCGQQFYAYEESQQWKFCSECGGKLGKWE